MMSVPVVDLAAVGADEALVRAWREVGFVSIVGHGIEPETFAQMRSMLARLFALPASVKQREMITRDNYRGFIPLGFFTPNRGEITGFAPDAYEGFKLHWECPDGHQSRRESHLYGGNRWVPEIEDMRDMTLGYCRQCDALGRLLLDIVATALRQDHDNFMSWFDAPLTNMTLLHYPPTPSGDDVGFHPHKDTNVITLLHPDPVGGLEIKGRGDEWISVDCPPEAIVVNTGEMLELWSGGQFVATPHRVVNRSGRERWSFPYFVVPNHDVVVEPLVTCREGFGREPMPVGELSAEVWRTNWPDEAPSDLGHDLGTLDLGT